MTDRAFELSEEIYEAVHNLVDQMLEDENADDQYAVRLKLTEEFRFWKRIKT